MPINANIHKYAYYFRLRTTAGLRPKTRLWAPFGSSLQTPFGVSVCGLAPKPQRSRQ